MREEMHVTGWDGLVLTVGDSERTVEFYRVYTPAGSRVGRVRGAGNSRPAAINCPVSPRTSSPNCW